MRYQLSLESDTDSLGGPEFENEAEAIAYAERWVAGSYRQEKGFSVTVYDTDLEEFVFVKKLKNK
jgi:hypothetical protein